MLGNRVAALRLCQVNSLPLQHWQIVPTFYQRVTLLTQSFPDQSQMSHWPGADTLKSSCVNNTCQPQSETDCGCGICKQGRIHTCTSVCDPICMPACLHIGMDRGRPNRTTADLLSGLQSAHLLTQGQWWADRCAHVPLPFPNAPQPTPDPFCEDWSSLCPVQSGSAAQTIPFPPQWTSMPFPQTFPGTGLKGMHRYGIWPI